MKAFKREGRLDTKVTRTEGDLKEIHSIDAIISAKPLLCGSSMPVGSPRISSWLFVVVAAACIVASTPFAAGSADDDSSAVYGVKIPPGYRGWGLVSVAHEAGNLNDIRAILGNPVTMKAFRDGTIPFPDGTIIARLAWKDTPSDENNAVFGRFQSFVAGTATNVQFMVKDTTKYSSTGGWGFGQFEDGKPTRNEALLKTCFPCHQPEKARDFVFTRLAQ